MLENLKNQIFNFNIAPCSFFLTQNQNVMKRFCMGLFPPPMLLVSIIMCSQNPRDYRFIENKGQLADMQGNVIPDQEYYVNNGPLNTYFSTNGFDVVYSKVDDDTSTTDTLWRINGNFINSHYGLSISPKDTSSFFYNYYLPQCPNGLTQVYAYSGIKVQELYSGISVEYNSTLSGYSMLFALNPERMPETIDIEFTGQDSMQIDTAGNLHIYTGLGEVLYPIPNAWYDSNYVSVSYTKTGNIISFSTANYTGSDTLYMEINQMAGIQMSCQGNLEWSTYFGDVEEDKINSCTNDTSNGDFYITGTTMSPKFPITTGAAFASLSWVDAFLSKFTSANKLSYSTFIGGSSSDFGNDLEIANGYVYVVGSTRSINLPTKATTPQYSVSTGGGFISRFDLVSGSLNWLTYYGGSGAGFEECNGITANDGGEIFVVGYTGKNNFPTEDLGYNSLYNPSSNTETGFILLFDSSCQREWATRFGAPGISTYVLEIIYYMRDIFIVGRTEDANNSNYFQTQESSTSFQNSNSYGGGTFDGFITKLGPINGSRFNIKWSTYLGGNKLDKIWSICSNSNGEIYIAGHTYSDQSFPVMKDLSSSSSHYISSLTGQGLQDGFIGKFSNDGTQQWTTYFGGDGNEGTDDIEVDQYDNVYVTGWASTTTSSSFSTKVFSGAYNQSNNNSQNKYTSAYISLFNSNSELVWSSLFGGEYNGARGNQISIYNSSCYLVGFTSTPSFIRVGKKGFPVCDPGNGAFMIYNLKWKIDPKNGSMYYSNTGFVSKFDISLFSPSSSVDKLDLNNMINIYPNPVTNKSLTISLPLNLHVLDVKIFDTIGKLLICKPVGELFNNSIIIDNVHLENGYYLLNVNTVKGVLTRSFIYLK